MSAWVRMTASAVFATSLAEPAHAIEYLSIAQSQRLAFPSATEFLALGAGVWTVKDGGRYIVDRVNPHNRGAIRSGIIIEKAPIIRHIRQNIAV